MVSNKASTLFGSSNGGINESKFSHGNLSGTGAGAPNYWAKGTGFGTGSTAAAWDVEGAQHRKQQEEEHVTWLMKVLSAYIHPGGELPPHMQVPYHTYIKLVYAG